MKVDRFDADVRVEGVLVEENRAARMVGHVKSLLKNIVNNIVRCFLQGKNMPFSPQFVSQMRLSFHVGGQIPVVDAEPLLHR